MPGNGSSGRRKRKADERQCDENWQNCYVFGLSQWLHGSSFLFLRYVDCAISGSRRDEEPSGEKSSARFRSVLAVPIVKNPSAYQEKNLGVSS